MSRDSKSHCLPPVKRKYALIYLSLVLILPNSFSRWYFASRAYSSDPFITDFFYLTATQHNCHRVPYSSENIEQKIYRIWTSHSSNSCVNLNFRRHLVIQCIRIVKNNISYIFNYFRAASGISIISKYVGPLVNKARLLYQ